MKRNHFFISRFVSKRKRSSRSHLIYSLRLQKNSDITLTVVDLAGTEPADISLPDSTESESVIINYNHFDIICRIHLHSKEDVLENLFLF
jgi:hypothetical protein